MGFISHLVATKAPCKESPTCSQKGLNAAGFYPPPPSNAHPASFPLWSLQAGAWELACTVLALSFHIAVLFLLLSLFQLLPDSRVRLPAKMQSERGEALHDWEEKNTAPLTTRISASLRFSQTQNKQINISSNNNNYSLTFQPGETCRISPDCLSHLNLQLSYL